MTTNTKKMELMAVIAANDVQEAAYAAWSAFTQDLPRKANRQFVSSPEESDAGRQLMAAFNAAQAAYEAAKDKAIMAYYIPPSNPNRSGYYYGQHMTEADAAMSKATAAFLRDFSQALLAASERRRQAGGV